MCTGHHSPASSLCQRVSTEHAAAPEEAKHEHMSELQSHLTGKKPPHSGFLERPQRNSELDSRGEAHPASLTLLVLPCS